MLDDAYKKAVDIALENAVIILVPSDCGTKRYRSFGTGFIHNVNGEQRIFTANHVVKWADQDKAIIFHPKSGKSTQIFSDVLRSTSTDIACFRAQENFITIDDLRVGIAPQDMQADTYAVMPDVREAAKKAQIEGLDKVGFEDIGVLRGSLDYSQSPDYDQPDKPPKEGNGVSYSHPSCIGRISVKGGYGNSGSPVIKVSYKGIELLSLVHGYNQNPGISGILIPRPGLLADRIDYVAALEAEPADAVLKKDRGF